MEMLRDLWAMIYSVFLFALGMAIVIAIWYWRPEVLTVVMDFNHSAIKWLGVALPEPYGPRSESALRLLAGEKAWLFFEASLTFRVMVFLLKHTLFRRRAIPVAA